MLTAIATLGLVFAPLTMEEEIVPPSPEQIEAALEALTNAYKDGDAGVIIAAIESGSDVLDGKVIDSIAKSLKNKDERVLRAGLEALRWMDHPDAVDELLSAHKRNKPLRKHETLASVLLKAIGQHGSPDAIGVLSDTSFDTSDRDSIQARILGLGMIRSKAAAESLVDLMQKSGRGRRRGGRGLYMEDFRLALTALTGDDQGPRREDWLEWWKDNKKKLEISLEMEELPRDLQRKWNKYWEIKPEKEGEEEGDDGGGGERRRRKRPGGDDEIQARS